MGEIARSSKCVLCSVWVQQQRNQRQWTEFFLVPKGRPAEKSLDPLLSTMEFRSNIRSQIVLHPLHPWLLLNGSFENDGTWCWWNLQATTEARCNPKCAPSITWPGGKKMAKLQLFNTYTFPGEHYRSVKRPRYVIFNITHVQRLVENIDNN